MTTPLITQPPTPISPSTNPPPPRPRDVWTKLFVPHVITTHKLLAAEGRQLYDALEKGRPVWIRDLFETDEVVWEDYTKLRLLRSSFVFILGDQGGYYRFEMDIDKFKSWLGFRYADQMLLEMDLISFLRDDDLRWLIFTKQYESFWRQFHKPLALEFRRGSKNQVYLKIRRTDLSSLRANFDWSWTAF